MPQIDGGRTGTVFYSDAYRRLVQPSGGEDGEVQYFLEVPLIQEEKINS